LAETSKMHFSSHTGKVRRQADESIKLVGEEAD
jgi:hypothetical protein